MTTPLSAQERWAVESKGAPDPQPETVEELKALADLASATRRVAEAETADALERAERLEPVVQKLLSGGFVTIQDAEAATRQALNEEGAA